jgi:hypothetical protein
MNLIKSSLLLFLLLLLKTQAVAQCDSEQANIDAIQKKYSSYFEDLQRKSNDLASALPDSTKLGSSPELKFDVVMKRSDFYLNLISVTMVNKKIILKLPQVTMRTKSFTTKGCKTEWKIKHLCCGIKTKVPVVTCWDQKNSFKIPEFKVANTDMIVKVPEFKNSKVHFAFNVPQLTMKNPIDDEKFRKLREQSEQIAARADSLNRNSASLETHQKEEVKNAIESAFTCIGNEILKERNNVSENYAISLNQIDQQIEELTSQGINVSNVKSDDGTSVNLLVLRNDVLMQEQTALDAIDATLAEVEQQRIKALKQLFQSEAS